MHLQMPAIANARAEVMATIAEATRAKLDADRYITLQLDRAASTQRAQQAVADRARADAQRTKAVGALEATERQLKVLVAQLHYAEARFAEARAAEEAAQLNVSYCEIFSPIEGELGNRNARPGGYATAGIPRSFRLRTTG